MCKTSNQIVFCTCIANKEGELVHEAKWTLDRYIGSKESKMRGKLMRQSHDIGSDIILENIISEMNKRNCFDFNYSPKERDCLHLDNGIEHPNYKYFSLIYKNGKWEQGNNPAFGRTISENLAKGKIKRT